LGPVGEGAGWAAEDEITDLGRGLAPLFAHLAEGATANLDKVGRARDDYDTDSARWLTGAGGPDLGSCDQA
jgi:hypothetical protein